MIKAITEFLGPHHKHYLFGFIPCYFLQKLRFSNLLRTSISIWSFQPTWAARKEVHRKPCIINCTHAIHKFEKTTKDWLYSSYAMDGFMCRAMLINCLIGQNKNSKVKNLPYLSFKTSRAYKSPYAFKVLHSRPEYSYFKNNFSSLHKIPMQKIQTNYQIRHQKTCVCICGIWNGVSTYAKPI